MQLSTADPFVFQCLIQRLIPLIPVGFTEMSQRFSRDSHPDCELIESKVLLSLLFYSLSTFVNVVLNLLRLLVKKKVFFYKR